MLVKCCAGQGDHGHQCERRAGGHQHDAAPGRRGDAELAAARQSARQQHACTHTTAAQPAPLCQHWSLAQRVQQGRQEPQHAGTAAPQCKRAADYSEPATKLSIVASAQGAQLHTGWASGCAPHRAADASTEPRPRSEDLHTPRGCAGQQHSLPASCSPSVTDPEHPALAPGTRLAVTQPGMQPGMQRPRPARYPIPLLALARRGSGLTLHARLPLRPSRPACPACRALGNLYDKMSARPGLESLLSRANVPHCLALCRNTVA